MSGQDTGKMERRAHICIADAMAEKGDQKDNETTGRESFYCGGSRWTTIAYVVKQPCSKPVTSPQRDITPQGSGNPCVYEHKKRHF